MQRTRSLPGQPLRHLRDHIGDDRDRGRGFRHFLRRDALDGVGRRVVDGEVLGGVSKIRHGRDRASFGNRPDVGTATARPDARESQREEQRPDLRHHGPGRGAPRKAECRWSKHAGIRLQRQNVIMRARRMPRRIGIGSAESVLLVRPQHDADRASGPDAKRLHQSQRLPRDDAADAVV